MRFFLAKNGLTDQLENILVNLIQPTRKEEGNIAYVLHRSIDNPDELMFDEIWIDKGSLEAHLKQPHVMSALERAASFIAKPIGVHQVFRNQNLKLVVFLKTLPHILIHFLNHLY